MATVESKDTAESRGWRRFRAVELRQAGWKQQEIADALGVTQGAVGQWLKAARTEGTTALLARKHPGPEPRLYAEQLQTLLAQLHLGAETHGFRGDLWTCPRVAE